MSETIEFLKRVPLFDGLNKRQLAQLEKRFVSRSYGSGEAMVTQGEGGEGLFVIVSGAAEAVRERADGSTAVVNTFGSTDFFGELALLHEGTRTASVICTADTTCLVLARWDFLAVMREDAEMGVIVAQELAKRFRKALDRL
jgi:CRP/FNR family transcriptional regulator